MLDAEQDDAYPVSSIVTDVCAARYSRRKIWTWAAQQDVCTDTSTGIAAGSSLQAFC